MDKKICITCVVTDEQELLLSYTIRSKSEKLFQIIIWKYLKNLIYVS